MTRARALAVAVALLFSSMPVQAGSPAVVSWRSIPSFVGDQEIEIRDPSSQRWKGRVVSVSAEALTIHDRDKGVTSVPRASVQEFRMKKRGKLWTLVGTGIGAALGAGLGAFVHTYSLNEGTGSPGITAAAVAVPTAIGFLVGFAADSSHKITVRVID